MRNPKTVAVVALVIAAVALGGCVGGQEDTDATPTPTSTIEAYDGDRSPDEIATAALRRTANATSYRVVTTTEVDLSLGTAETRTDATVDRERNRTRTNTTIDSDLTGSRNVQTFRDNDTVYVKPGVDADWQRQPERNSTDGRSGSGVDQLDQQRRLLASDNVTLEGTTTLDGRDVYVLRTEPDTGAFTSEFTGQADGPTSGLDVDDAVARLYVDTETDHLRQVTLRGNATAEDQEITVRSTTRFTDYGIDADLEPPTVGNETN